MVAHGMGSTNWALQKGMSFINSEKTWALLGAMCGEDLGLY